MFIWQNDTNIFSLSPWNLEHESVWLVHKKMLFNTFMYFFGIFFFVFHHKICVFIIFISFSDKVSNFRNRILTNQKRELVVSNCQLNCMLMSSADCLNACSHDCFSILDTERTKHQFRLKESLVISWLKPTLDK